MADEYAKFCERNDLNSLGKVKFNQTIKVQLGLVQKAVRSNKIKDFTENYESLEDASRVIKAWCRQKDED